MYPETNLQGSLSGDAPPCMMELGWVSADLRDPSPLTCTFPQIDSKLTEAEWESYKNTIHGHYMVEKKSLSALIDTMGKTHNFHASKSQYEGRLKKWGFHKNLTKEVWVAVDHRISKRKRDGKESEVYRGGKLMRPEKVRKETLRNRFPPTSKGVIPSSAPSPELPSGLAVCTPAGSEVTWPKTLNLPWLRFASFLERTETKDLESATQHDLRSVFPGRDLLSTELDITFEVSSRLRIPQMPEGLQTSMTRLVSNTTVGSRTGEVLELTTRLDAIIPEKRVEEHSSTASMILGSTDQNARLQLTKFAIYLLSNDLATPTRETRCTIIKWLHHKENTRLLASLLSVQEPTIQALKEGVFRAAILAEDFQIVRIVLESGLDTDEQRVEYGGWRITPLQCVCQRGNLEIVRLLITGGANVDAQGRSPLGSPLAYAAHSGNTEILKVMIAANTKVNPQGIFERSALNAAISNEHLDSLQILISAGADVNGADECQEKPLHHAAKTGHTKVIETLLQAGADVNATDLKGTTPLDVAVKGYLLTRSQYDDDYDDNEDLDDDMENFRASIHCILNAGPSSLESALAFAVAEGDAKLVREILRTGLHVDSLVPLLKFGEGPCWSVTALTAAAFHNNAELVTLFLEEQADVDGGSHVTSLNSMLVVGLTPLQIASLHDSTEILVTLLFSGADVNRPAHEEKDYSESVFVGTALQTAAFKGHLVQCKLLLNAGANVNTAAGATGFTALQAASQSQNPTIVKILLEAGADINAPASPGKGLTALQAAVRRRDFDLVNYLLNWGADINAPAALPSHNSRIAYNDGMTALSAAAQQDNQQLVSLLLAHGADVNGRSPKKGAETALTAALENNNEIVAYLLLASGANADDSNALLAATENSNDKFVGLLLSLRASSLSPPMEGYGSTALKSAISQGRCDLVRMLLASGIDVNEPVLDYNYSAPPGGSRFEPKHVLDAAVIKGSPAMVQTLLDAGADPNRIVPNWSMSILQHATYLKRADMVRMLLNVGTNPNTPAQGKMGRTALQAAAGNGCFDLVEMLLEANADANAPPGRDAGATALQAAAIGGYCGTVSRLLKAGADVNAAGAVINGRTAIEGAAEHGRIDVLQLLLDNGALIEGPGRAQYDRAISFAVEMGNHTARRLLQSHHEELYGFK